MESKLYNYGKRIFTEENLLEKRKIGFIYNYNDNLLESIKEIIDYENYDYDIIHKINKEGFHMKWHFDNAKIIKHKKDITNLFNNIHLYDNYYLHYYLRKPIYTLIIYNSDYEEDFTGGELEFVDKTIYPKKGLYVFFDSRELHKVNKITSGKRENYLIKFYFHSNE